MTCRTGSWREDVRRFRGQYGPEPSHSNDNRIGVQHRSPTGDAGASARPSSSCGSRDEGLLPSRRAHPLPPPIPTTRQLIGDFLALIGAVVFVGTFYLLTYATLGG